MNIGQAASASGVSAKMIRYYEAVGLLPTPARSDANYRLYDAQQVHLLRFIKHARELGFSLAEVKALLALWLDRRRSSAKVKTIAQRHLADLEAKIQALSTMKQTLTHLVHCCHGDERPDCPILAEIARA